MTKKQVERVLAKAKEGQIVELIWRDANSDDDWYPANKMTPKNLLVNSAGLFHSTADGMLLIAGAWGSNGFGCMWLNIPVDNIIAIQVRDFLA